ncbi:MAG: hypothetical protein DI537_10115 [Stutzerimonas stutzeri]|nr:MAG: hypothetical protein DI537_10115 [Stutzerimonas stutzeri]
MMKKHFKAEHRTVRAEARRKANITRGCDPSFVSRLVRSPNHGIISIGATRHHLRSPSKPAEIRFAIIIDRPIRQRIADDLAWAAVYRRDAFSAHKQCNPQLKRVYIAAAKECLKDAGALRTPFASLPG